MKLLLRLDLPDYIESNTDLNKKLSRQKELAWLYFGKFLIDDKIDSIFVSAKFSLLGNGATLVLQNEEENTSASIRIYNQTYIWTLYVDKEECDGLPTPSQVDSFSEFRAKLKSA